MGWMWQKAAGKPDRGDAVEVVFCWRETVGELESRLVVCRDFFGQQSRTYRGRQVGESRREEERS